MEEEFYNQNDSSMQFMPKPVKSDFMYIKINQSMDGHFSF